MPILDTLEARLGPVLMPDNSGGASTGGTAEDSGTPMHILQVDCIAQRIHSVGSRLADIAERIAL
jgi:hypothetical protein